MKKVGITLVMAGLLLAGWNGYLWWKGFQAAVPFSGSVQAAEPLKAKKQLNPAAFHKGENVAELTIPRLNKTFDVFWGTNLKILAKGVGMYVSQWTVPPGNGGHTVLAGHRDTVFRNLGNLQKGDSVYVTYGGKDYEYRIDKIWITDKNDRTVIVKKQHPTLTLSTCYPFDYIGHAPNRYIVQGHLVKKGNLLK
ncbi:MAG TPA: class D sortase [Bacillales bacterium]|nr:class D sortase [Bacillales bacterium]